MKKTLLTISGTLLLLALTHDVQAQYGANKDVSVQLRQLYLKNTYGVTTEQVAQYERALADKNAKQEELKAQKISGGEFTERAEAIFKAFSKQVRVIFDVAQYEQWKAGTQHSEWYRYLGEDLQIPVDVLDRQRQMVREHIARRKAILSDPMDEKTRYSKEELNRDLFRENTVRILGETFSEKYLYERSAHSDALKNMNRYGVNYTLARRIAEIELDFDLEKKRIRASNLQSTARTDAFMENEDRRDEALQKALPAETLNRWYYINRNALDYSLKTKYKLTKEQVAKFKELYNKYAIEEYKILNSTAANKKEEWSKANQAFCESVKPLFASDRYDVWLGKRMHDFELAQKKRELRNKL